VVASAQAFARNKSFPHEPLAKNVSDSECSTAIPVRETTTRQAAPLGLAHCEFQLATFTGNITG
jgi:hypothetical protein